MELPDIKQSDVEDKSRKGLYGAGRAGTIAEIVRDNHFPTGTRRHLPHGGDPSCDEFVETECGRSPLLGLIEDLSVYELTSIIYSHETLRRRLLSFSFGYLPVHHTIEHYLHAWLLGVLLKKLLVSQLISIICRGHINDNRGDRRPHRYPLCFLQDIVLPILLHLRCIHG